MHLSQTGLVLLLNSFDFFLSIVIDLAHSLCIVFLHSFNFLLQLLNLILLYLDLVSVVLRLLISVGSVFIVDLGLGLMELASFFFLLLRQLLIASGIFKHFLIVLVALALKLFVLLLSKLLDSFLKFFFHLLLGDVQLLIFVSVLQLHA